MSGQAQRKWRTVLVLVVGAVLGWWSVFYWVHLPDRKPVQEAAEEAVPEPAAEPGGGAKESAAGSGRMVQGAIPKPEAGAAGKALPPSPPLPEVAPDTSEAQRKELFDLHESVDRIVRPQEPFEVGGRSLTIEAITQGRGLPAGSSQPRGELLTEPESPLDASAYYGVRRVRVGENVWNIHYQILRDYFRRRQVELAPTADEADASGRSSGVGRLLKFLEGVVYVYDVKNRRLAADIHRVQPQSIIVLFKISDLFAVLDQLQPEDLAGIRYTRHELVLQRDRESKALLRPAKGP